MKLLGISEIQFMNLLDAILHVSARDCFVDGDNVVFLVNEKDMYRAIGKGGSAVELLTKRIGKRVELFEYTQEPEKFFQKAFFRAKIEKVGIKDLKEKKIAIISVDATNKKIILQNMRRLKRVKDIAKRNYGIEEVRIR